MDVRFHYSDHLVGLVEDAAAAAARIAAAPPEGLAAEAQRAKRDAGRLSARLDASPLDDATADAVDAGTWVWPAGKRRFDEPAGERRSDDSAGNVAAPQAGGWATALKLDGMATQQVAAVEYANLLACYDAEAELADQLFEAPLTVLTTLHGLICRGLVAPQVVGRPRRTIQAVHDGAQGRVLYNTPDPRVVPRLVDGLVEWLGATGSAGSAGLPTLVVAGVVHERLLEWQPFEAGNGRLARATARLVLRARGLDPTAVAVPERTLAADPSGYHNEVAATIHRRGDLGPWLEWHTEAVVAGLAAVARRLVGHSPAPPARAVQIAGRMAFGATITLGQYAAATGLSRDTAAADLRALVSAGTLRRDPHTRGLTFRRR
ncbi:MAG: Fic family protein [Euzebyaceae bacterium]|jgi:Fic family protein|nr:Fic family protein [Euzebyaceae bacterium]